MSQSNITAYINNSFTFFKSAWIALGDADLRFSLILVRKPMLFKRELNEPRGYITNVMNLYMWLMAW
jgi:hypothetical protein